MTTPKPHDTRKIDPNPIGARLDPAIVAAIRAAVKR